MAAATKSRSHPAALLLGLGLAAAPITASPAGASSPQAWQDYGQQVLKACSAASTLRSPRPAGNRVDLNGRSGALVSALLLEGSYPQPHMAGRHGLELCLYDAHSRQASVADANNLQRGTRP
jgi:hypothetical protein